MNYGSHSYRLFTSLHALVMSFYSADLYKDVAKYWQGLGLSYLFLIICLYASVETSYYQEKINSFIKNDAPAIIKQIPTMTIENGTLIAHVKMPVVIKHPESKQPLIVIDTTGKTTSPQQNGAFVLVNQTHIIFRDDVSNVEPLPLKAFDGQVISPETVTGFLKSLKDWFSLAFFPVFLLLAYFYYALQMLLCAVMGKFVCRILDVDLDFRAIARIVSVAFTPALFLVMLHSTFDIPYPMSSVFTMMFTMGYMIFGIGANVHKK